MKKTVEENNALTDKTLSEPETGTGAPDGFAENGVSAENADEYSETADNGNVEEKKRSRLSAFFADKGALIALLAALAVVLAALALAVTLGGDVYDKAAVLFAAAFLGEFFYGGKTGKRKLGVVLTVFFGVAAVAFTVLYALEIKGILP